MILDAAETVLGYFGLIGLFMGIRKVQGQENGDGCKN
jgi:cadmium resistance protein CadD (predicted permease)